MSWDSFSSFGLMTRQRCPVRQRVRPMALVWKAGPSASSRREEGCITFDVTILDQDFSHRIILPGETSRFALGALNLAFDDSHPLMQDARAARRGFNASLRHPEWSPQPCEDERRGFLSLDNA
ncbi:hypothetical protein [Cupriavidus sp. IDO]|uniref:hypothetical protein n=1 Tax=Cupriavidus sp. IDO TaxID=1539142 RepID=UPI00126A7965|nr:hypothetical protein [Cupriavidus sp. IDO]